MAGGNLDKAGGASPGKKYQYDRAESGFQVTAGDFVTSKASRIKDEYEMKAVVGTGAYGEVRKVKHKKSKQIRACKIINKAHITKDQQKSLIKEVEILTQLDHANIMKVYEVFEDDSKFYIISEFLEGGELFDRISKYEYFSEKEAAEFMQQILSAVAYCHSHNIVHRDLKPENLVFDSTKKNALLKVIDFGTANHIKPNEKLHETYGTAYYMAPEVLTGKYNYKCDVWSCGVIMYILLSGAPPFPGKNDKDILKKVKKGIYSFTDDVWKDVSKEAISLVKNMMQLDVEKRFTAQDALASPWFKFALKHEFDKPLAKQNLERLKNLRFESKLQEVTWVFLVNFFSTKEDKEKLLKTFKALDIDGDGQLTEEELRKGYVSIMGMSEEEARAEADRIMKSIDTNNSGSIDYSEFVNATIDRSALLTTSRLEAAFKLFDKDGNGKITADEMKMMFDQKKVEGIPDGVWQDWIREVDENGDDGISFSEFKHMMHSLLKKV